jgi:YesN/AraC family two-component response regulator
VSRALPRIERSDDPLCVIAREIGYKNPSRFTEIFKKTDGVTPKEYRKGKNG